jgi:hypothetical protein
MGPIIIALGDIATWSGGWWQLNANTTIPRGATLTITRGNMLSTSSANQVVNNILTIDGTVINQGYIYFGNGTHINNGIIKNDALGIPPDPFSFVKAGYIRIQGTLENSASGVIYNYNAAIIECMGPLRNMGVINSPSANVGCGIGQIQVNGAGEIQNISGGTVGNACPP